MLFSNELYPLRFTPNTLLRFNTPALTPNDHVRYSDDDPKGVVPSTVAVLCANEVLVNNPAIVNTAADFKFNFIKRVLKFSANVRK